MQPNAISGSGASGSTSGAGDRLATTDPKSVVRQHGGPVVGDGSSNDTTFYITLTIEQDDDDDDPLERIDNSGKKCDNYVPQWWVEFNDELSWLFTKRFRDFCLICRK